MIKTKRSSLKTFIREVLKEESAVFHGYKFPPEKIGLPGPEFEDSEKVSKKDLESAKEWLKNNDPDELYAFSRGSAVLDQLFDEDPSFASKEIPKVTYVSPAALRKWTDSPVPNLPKGGKVIHSLGDNIVPIKQACKIASNAGIDMYVAPGKGDGKDHVRALQYKSGEGTTKIDSTKCSTDEDLPDWGREGNASSEELEKQIEIMKKYIDSKS